MRFPAAVVASSYNPAVWEFAKDISNGESGHFLLMVDDRHIPQFSVHIRHSRPGFDPTTESAVFDSSPCMVGFCATIPSQLFNAVMNSDVGSM